MTTSAPVVERFAMTHKHAEDLFSQRDKWKDFKVLAGNTRLYYNAYGNIYFIVYHDTTIIQIYPDGSYRLNSGGWQTHSTKERLNTYLFSSAQVRIFQKNRKWWIESLRWPEQWEFRDNIAIKGGELC